MIPKTQASVCCLLHPFAQASENCVCVKKQVNKNRNGYSHFVGLSPRPDLPYIASTLHSIDPCGLLKWDSLQFLIQRDGVLPLQCKSCSASASGRRRFWSGEQYRHTGLRRCRLQWHLFVSHDSHVLVFQQSRFSFFGRRNCSPWVSC